MRIVVYGVGAIGGALAVRLAKTGHQVIGIARGAQLEAIQQNGLTLRAPDGVHHVEFECVSSPAEIDFAEDDTILLCMKSQDTQTALEALREAGVDQQAIVCAQNGVDNERMALRLFPNVLGMVVMMPSTYTEPGEIGVLGAPKYGLFDIGALPKGISNTVRELCDALESAGFGAFPHEDVMRAKYGKLLLNLANGVNAVLGMDAINGPYAERVKNEALAVYKAAGIEYDNVGADNPRRKELLQVTDVPGVERVGSSSAQSLVRGAGSIETDYLNGEIALLGRLYGVPTPANALFARLAAELARSGAQPGSMAEEDVIAALNNEDRISG